MNDLVKHLRSFVAAVAALAIALGAAAGGSTATERVNVVLADPGCCRGG